MATPRRMRTAMRARVDVPGVRFALLNLPGFEFRSACRARSRANARGSARSLTAGHRQGPMDRYFKFRIGTASDERKINRGNAGNTPDSGRVAPTTTAATPDFRAARPKSANTNLRHAHRLFSSDHQPAQHPRCPPACPRHFPIQAAARWICARRLGGQIPRLGRFCPRDVFRPSRVTINTDRILTSARAVVRQY